MKGEATEIRSQPDSYPWNMEKPDLLARKRTPWRGCLYTLRPLKVRKRAFEMKGNTSLSIRLGEATEPKNKLAGQVIRIDVPESRIDIPVPDSRIDIADK